MPICLKSTLLERRVALFGKTGYRGHLFKMLEESPDFVG